MRLMGSHGQWRWESADQPKVGSKAQNNSNRRQRVPGRAPITFLGRAVKIRIREGLDLGEERGK